jgi:NADPH:quinone reductase
MPDMRAIVCHRAGSFRDTQVEMVPRPAMCANGVRIAVHAASISFSIALMIEGKYQRKFPLPFIPGTEVTGMVIEVAAGVVAVKPGDRVLAICDWGGYAEEVVTPYYTVYPLPDQVSLDDAPHLGMSYGTSYGGLYWRAGLKQGDALLVLGAAGGVGLAAVELGRVAGATVIAAAGNAAKCDLARDHGAHHTIDTSRDDLRDGVQRVTGGAGLDIVYDPIGGDLSEAALRLLKLDGRIVLIGFAAGRVPNLPANILLVKNLSVIGYNHGAYMGWGPGDGRDRHEPKTRAMYKQIFGWAAEGKLRPHTSASFPLEEFPAAMDFLIARQSTGKVILRVR